MLIDWSWFVCWTPKGILLTHSTVEAALMDLDQWAFYQRTGAEMPKGQRLTVVPWGGVLGNDKVGMSVSSIDRKKLFKILEEDLELWESVQASRKTAAGPTVDPAMIKSVTAALHKVFSALKTDTLDIGGLAGVYTAQEGGDYDDNKLTIRGVLNHPASNGVFSMGLGGSPKVSRLLTATGKKTGAEPQSRERKPNKAKD